MEHQLNGSTVLNTEFWGVAQLSTDHLVRPADQHRKAHARCSTAAHSKQAHVYSPVAVTAHTLSAGHRPPHASYTHSRERQRQRHAFQPRALRGFHFRVSPRIAQLW